MKGTHGHSYFCKSYIGICRAYVGAWKVEGYCHNNGESTGQCQMKLKMGAYMADTNVMVPASLSNSISVGFSS